MPKDVIVKIGIVGDYTEDNVKLISERPGSIFIHNILLANKNRADIIFVHSTIFVYRENSVVGKPIHMGSTSTCLL